MIRAATADDLASLLAIEQDSFQADRISRRSFRYLLTTGHSLTLLDMQNGRVRGYITLLFKAGVRSSRVYSVATDAAYRGRGVAAALLKAAERAALAYDCEEMRLEVRKDNLASLTLFGRRGYCCFGEYASYYEDGMDAFRLSKRLSRVPGPDRTFTAFL
jgi:ribosomal protein S18 acetylase RimI-like enzyme